MIRMIPIAGHLTYIFIACSYFVKDILWLRTVAVFASIASIIFNYFALSEPLWIPIGWNFLFILINGTHLYQICFPAIKQQTLNHQEIDLARTFFADASPQHIALLFHYANWQEVSAGQVLLRQGSISTELHLFYEGELQAIVDGVVCREIEKRMFLGEIGFLTGQPVTATVRTVAPSKLLVWKVKDLHRALDRNPSLKLLFHNSLAVDLSRKLSSHTSLDEKISKQFDSDAKCRSVVK